jgi:predicted GNAT family acetyltransferase
MIVESLGPDLDTIGARAARHLEIAFGAVMKGPQTVHDPRFMRLVTGEMHPMGNLAVVYTPGDEAAALEAALPLLDCGAPACVIFSRGARAGVAETLKARGFGVEAKMPAMAVDIDAMAATSLPAGYGWARIGAGAEGRAWAEALAVGYEIPRPLADIFSPQALGADMADDAQVQFFAVLHDGRQVATSMLYLADGLAGIYCVSTVPEERSKGLGAHATAEALRVARRLGYRVGVLQSSTAGYPVYIRLGFGDYAKVPMFIHMPG